MHGIVTSSTHVVSEEEEKEVVLVEDEGSVGVCIEDSICDGNIC